MTSSEPQQKGVTRSSQQERLAAVFAQRNYELLGELGRGGMGIVYLARDTKLGRKVALKTLSPDRATRENSLRRFEREARTFAQIRHPHIATLYEFADAGPLQYLALEYIDGYDLESERRRGKKWPGKEAAAVIGKVASALEYTHQKGILHRDIKPGNILIEAETNRVVLTDFGLAKGRKDETLTASGFAVGTPAYMAPEQITDQFEVKPDGRSDVFSLGTVLYEMLTGEHPFIGQDDLKTMRNIVQVDPPSMRKYVPDIPDSMELIVASMLRKHPNERIARAGLVADLLEAFAKDPNSPEIMKLLGLRPTEERVAKLEPAKGMATPATPEPVPALGAPASKEEKPPLFGGDQTKTMIVIAVLVGVAMLIMGLLVGRLL